MVAGKGLSRASTQLGLLGSLCLHLSVTLWVTSQPHHPTPSIAAPPWSDFAVEVEVQGAGFPLATPTSPTRDTQVLTGGLLANAADTWQRGGTTGGAATVVNLGSRIGESTIRDVSQNNRALDQVQRIRTSESRQSSQRARQTPNPASAAVLSTGQGKSDARTRRRTQRPHRSDSQAEERKTELGPGGEQPVIVQGQSNQSAAAKTAASSTLRPDLTRGRATTDTAWHAQRPADNVDSTSASRASTDGNIEQTPSKLGHDGVGVGDTSQLPGARSLAASPMSGPLRGPVGNAAYDRWLADQRRAIGDELRFPQARKVSLDQGISVFELLVSRDGRVLEGPSLIRSSGFDDFDSEGRRAINATRFAPLPRSLTLGDRPLKVTMVVRFFNPMTF